MKKILTLFIALILVVGIVSVAKSYTIDDDVWSGSATRYPKDRHIVQSSDGTIVVVYRTWDPPTDVRAAKSINNGANWYKLDGTSEGYTVLCGVSSIKDQNLSICIDADDNIYLTYLRGSLNDYDVFFKKLTAQVDTSSTTWTLGTERTVDDTNDNYYPTITREESGPTAGRVWVAYGQDDNGTSAWVNAMHSDDDFQTAGTPTTVTTGGVYSTYYNPAIFIRDDSPYIVYNNNNTGHYNLEYSVWGGSSWSGGIVSGPNASPGYDFSVTLITTTVHVAWFASGTLRHTYSYNGTTNWTTEVVSTSQFGDPKEDCEVSLTTDWDTDDVELWCFKSIYYEDSGNQYEDWNIKRRKWNGSSWGSWDTVGIGDSTKERHATTPFISRGHVPVAYTYDRTDPYRVEFDYSIILDTTSPEAIDDLAGTCPTGDVILTWDTPGDNGGSGTLPEMSGYRLDYSSVTKTWDKDDYEVWIPTHGVTPGTGVSHTVASLQEDTNWYFCIWTRDEVPNWSGLSNGCTVWVSAPSQTYNWDGGGAEGDWDDADNWDVGGSYPDDATDKAIINTGSESISTPGTALTIGELELGSDYSGTLTLGGNFILDDSGPWVGNLTISNASATLDLIGYNLTIPGTFSNNGTLKLQGDETVSKAPTNNSGSTVEYTATSGSRAIKNWTYQSLKINGADGTFTLGTGETLGENLIVSTGTFDLNGSTLTINGTTTIEAGAMKISTNTVTFGNNTGNDSVSITGGELHIESDDTSSDIVLYLGSGSWSNTGGTIIYDGSTVNTDLLFSLSSYNNLTINSAGSTYTLDGDITVNGDLTINDGTLDTDANNYAISVGGDWNRAGGTFTVNNSTVTFITASSTSTLTGSTTFYVLVSTATGKNVKVSSDTVIGVTSHLNFENITLRSTLDNATWYLNLQGTQDVHHVNVRDSNADDGDTILDFDCPDIVSCYYGNNTNWDFGPPAAITDLTGLCDSDTGDVTLYWSTPGDDEWTGTLVQGVDGSKYIIDYSTDSTKQWDKGTYEVSIPTSGVAPHTEVSYTITGLTGDSTWYFRIWTADEIPLWSGLSNGATVWVNPILSVTIEPSSRPFGEVPANQSDVLSDEFTVENTGNITQKYQLRLTGVPTGWTAKNVAGAPGWEEVKILGLFTTQSPPNTTHFNDNPPNTGDGDIVRTTNDDEATSANFAISTEGVEVKGYNVTVGGIRYLWFRFDAPSGTTITNEQFLTVTVTAVQQ